MTSVTRGARSAPRVALEKPATLDALATLGADEVLLRYRTSLSGLTSHEAAARRRQYGLNRAVSSAPESPMRLLFSRLRNPLNVLLLVLAAVSLATGDSRAAAVIMTMVALSVTLGFGGFDTSLVFEVPR